MDTREIIEIKSTVSDIAGMIRELHGFFREQFGSESNAAEQINTTLEQIGVQIAALDSSIVAVANKVKKQKGDQKEVNEAFDRRIIELQLQCKALVETVAHINEILSTPTNSEK